MLAAQLALLDVIPHCWPVSHLPFQAHLGVGSIARLCTTVVYTVTLALYVYFEHAVVVCAIPVLIG